MAINNYILLCGLFPQKFKVGYGIKILLGHIIFNKRMLVKELVFPELFLSFTLDFYFNIFWFNHLLKYFIK